MIDLHLHTTASDGLLSPEALVARASAAGLRIISVTDHDTLSGLADARRSAAALGIRIVPGIEITAIQRDRDVHILGYFIDPGSESLGRFLRDQRENRVTRVRAIAAKLDSLGCCVDVEALISTGRSQNRSVGRPAIADALVATHQAIDRNDAFDRLLARGRAAYVPRAGLDAAGVIDVIHSAGGIASLAHPGVLDDDALIPRLVDVGLDALEVWHSDHTAEHQRRYTELAAQFRLARSGGSDFHGDGLNRASQLGRVSLPLEAFAALEARAPAQ